MLCCASGPCCGAHQAERRPFRPQAVLTSDASAHLLAEPLSLHRIPFEKVRKRSQAAQSYSCAANL